MENNDKREQLKRTGDYKRPVRRRQKKRSLGSQEDGRPQSRSKKGARALSPAAQRGLQKRKERRRQRLKKFFRRTLIVLAVLAVLALIFIFGFRLKNINVTGNSRYTKEEILDLLHYDGQYHNTFIFYMKNRNMDVEGIPFINAIHMEIGGNDTINVEVAEKIVTGCIDDDGRYIYIDTDGIVCEISDTHQEDVPLLEGLEFEAPVLNQMLIVTDQTIYNSLVNLTLLLEKHEILIEKIVFNEDGTMKMQMGDIQVMLGNSENMEDKMTELKNLLPQLENLKGTLHLENYDSTKDSIIFTKES
ncbi:MAG: cell division protein FtsQ/DivIB [Clostridiales bacterium]|nr:cell division protein FtsQ/DivIB [Clostridiales bacterium]